MLPEHEPKQTAQNAFIEVDGKRMPYNHKDWYTSKDIADMVGNQLPIVSTHLNRIRKNDENIKFTTLGDLRRRGKITSIGSPHTIVYDEENFKKAVTAVASIKTKPPRKEKKPKNAKGNNPSPLNPFVSITESPPQPPTHSKDKDKNALPLRIKNPEQILAENSVIKALSHLANGTLKDISHDIQELLEQAAMEHVRLRRFEDDPKEGILIKIFYTDSTNRLNRFFRVNLDAFLDDLWNITDAKKITSKEEQQMIEICNQLKEKGYDKERVSGELYGHFGIIIQNKIVHPV